MESMLAHPTRDLSTACRCPAGGAGAERAGGPEGLRWIRYGPNVSDGCFHARRYMGLPVPAMQRVCDALRLSCAHRQSRSWGAFT